MEHHLWTGVIMWPWIAQSTNRKTWLLPPQNLKFNGGRTVYFVGIQKKKEKKKNSHFNTLSTWRKKYLFWFVSFFLIEKQIRSSNFTKIGDVNCACVLHCQRTFQFSSTNIIESTREKSSLRWRRGYAAPDLNGDTNSYKVCLCASFKIKLH